MSLVSFDESVFSRNLMKILAFISFSFFFFFLVEVFSSLMTYSFFSQFDAFSKSYLSLMGFLSF